MRLVLYINLFWSIHFFARQKLVMQKLPLMKFLWPSSAVNKSDVSIYFPWQNTHPFISWIRKWQDDQNRKVQLTITISPLGHFAKEKKKERWISVIPCKVWFLGWQAGNIQLSEEMFHLYLRIWGRHISSFHGSAIKLKNRLNPPKLFVFWWFFSPLLLTTINI